MDLFARITEIIEVGGLGRKCSKFSSLEASHLVTSIRTGCRWNEKTGMGTFSVNPPAARHREMFTAIWRAPISSVSSTPRKLKGEGEIIAATSPPPLPLSSNPSIPTLSTSLPLPKPCLRVARKLLFTRTRCCGVHLCPPRHLWTGCLWTEAICERLAICRWSV